MRVSVPMTDFYIIVVNERKRASRKLRGSICTYCRCQHGNNLWKNVYVLFKERGHEKVKSPLRSFKFHRKKSPEVPVCVNVFYKRENLLVQAAIQYTQYVFQQTYLLFLKRLVTFRHLSENNPRQLCIVTEVRSPYNVKLSLSIGKEVIIVLRILKMESAVWAIKKF